MGMVDFESRQLADLLDVALDALWILDTLGVMLHKDHQHFRSNHRSNEIEPQQWSIHQGSNKNQHSPSFHHRQMEGAPLLVELDGNDQSYPP